MRCVVIVNPEIRCFWSISHFTVSAWLGGQRRITCERVCLSAMTVTFVARDHQQCWSGMCERDATEFTYIV
jgi:hypothetical protein